MSTLQEEISAILQNAFPEHYTSAVILAAGSSTRMGIGKNKQLEEVNGAPVLAHTLMAYQKCPLIAEIVVVARPDDFPAIQEIKKNYGITKFTQLTAGGKTRQASAQCGVAKISADCRYVAIADGARCLIKWQDIARVCLAAYSHKAASAGHLIPDTVKRASVLGKTRETVDRTGLWAVQTPQIFHTSLYKAALLRAAQEKSAVTDDNSLIENLGYAVTLIECGAANLKITTAEDLPLAEAILSYREKEQ